MILLQTATLINLFSSVINDNSAGKLSEVAIKSSSTKSYLFLSWVLYLSTEKANSSFPLLKNLELIPLINTFLLHGLNPRPSLYNASAKNHLIVSKTSCSKAYFLWVFVAISGCRKFLISGFYLTINSYVFDHWKFPNMMSPGITVKTSG